MIKDRESALNKDFYEIFFTKKAIHNAKNILERDREITGILKQCKEINDKLKIIEFIGIESCSKNDRIKIDVYYKKLEDLEIKLNDIINDVSI